MSKKLKKNISTSRNQTALKLKVLAKKKETVRRKLVVTAKNLATTAKEKETVRRKLVVTAEKKENIRGRLAVTAKKLVVTAKEKELVRSKLAVTAKQLVLVAKEKENVRRSLVITAKNLAKTAKEKESIKHKLAITAETLRLKAKQLASIATEKENIRLKLAITAKNLAVFAKEKELVRSKLVKTARELAVTAREKETVRNKLVTTAKQLAKTAKEKELVRNKLVVTAKNLATFAKEKETVRRKLAITAKELKESYNVLEQAKAKDEAMLASIGDAVMACDKSGKVILFNIRAETLSGYSAKEAIGKHYSHSLNFIKENGEKLSVDFIVLAIKTGQKTKMESRTLLIKKDGKKIPVADSAAPVKNTQGKIIGCVVVFRDISLEREVVRMKDEFLSLASHELRTPMTSVAGFIDMILEGRYGELTEELRTPLGYVAESTDRLIRLVNDLLNVSRIEAGRMTFNMRSIDLSETVLRVVAGLQPIALKRNIKLIFDKKDEVNIQGDIEKVEQILNNLIGNALKFTDKGSILIVVKNESDLGVVQITDTGVGIPVVGRNRLFGKFEQINTDPAGRPPGTGLGLYLSHQMAQKMGGDIKLITSTLGKGSTFGFSLPIVDSSLSKNVLTEIKGSIVSKE